MIGYKEQKGETLKLFSLNDTRTMLNVVPLEDVGDGWYSVAINKNGGVHFSSINITVIATDGNGNQVNIISTVKDDNELDSEIDLTNITEDDLPIEFYVKGLSETENYFITLNIEGAVSIHDDQGEQESVYNFDKLAEAPPQGQEEYYGLIIDQYNVLTNNNTDSDYAFFTKDPPTQDAVSLPAANRLVLYFNEFPYKYVLVSSEIDDAFTIAEPDNYLHFLNDIYSRGDIANYSSPYILPNIEYDEHKIYALTSSDVSVTTDNTQSRDEFYANYGSTDNLLERPVLLLNPYNIQDYSNKTIIYGVAASELIYPSLVIYNLSNGKSVKVSAGSASIFVSNNNGTIITDTTNRNYQTKSGIFVIKISDDGDIAIDIINGAYSDTVTINSSYLFNDTNDVGNDKIVLAVGGSKTSIGNVRMRATGLWMYDGIPSFGGFVLPSQSTGDYDITLNSLQEVFIIQKVDKYTIYFDSKISIGDNADAFDSKIQIGGKELNDTIISVGTASHFDTTLNIGANNAFDTKISIGSTDYYDVKLEVSTNASFDTRIDIGITELFDVEFNIEESSVVHGTIEWTPTTIVAVHFPTVIKIVKGSEM
jgi:hypothetical protein